MITYKKYQLYLVCNIFFIFFMAGLVHPFLAISQQSGASMVTDGPFANSSHWGDENGDQYGLLLYVAVDDSQGAATITSVEVSSPGETTYPLYDDGNHCDGEAGDGIFSWCDWENQFSDPPAIGEYEFIITDSDGHIATATDTVEQILDYPRNPSPSNYEFIDGDSAELSWEPVAEASNYSLSVVKDADDSEVWSKHGILGTSVAYNDDGTGDALTEGTVYRWGVGASDEFGNSSWHHTSNAFIYNSDAEAPVALLRDGGVGSIHNDWNQGEDWGLHFSVLAADPQGVEDIRSVWVEDPQGDTYFLFDDGHHDDNGSADGVYGNALYDFNQAPLFGAYTFHVLDQSGNKVTVQDNLSAVLDLPEIITPTNGGMITNPSFPIDWEPVPNASRYHIWIEDDDHSIWFWETSETSCTYNQDGTGEALIEGKIYHLSVFALDGKNHSSAGVPFVYRGGVVCGNVSTSDGDPIENAEVRLFSEKCWEAPDAAVVPTDSNGDFAVSLPPGEYYVYAEATAADPSHINQWWGGVETLSEWECETAQKVAVQSGSESGGIDFSIDQGGCISGTVTDAATGQPLPPGNIGSISLEKGWHRFTYRYENTDEYSNTARAAFKFPGGDKWEVFSTTHLNLQTEETNGEPGILLTTKRNTWNRHPQTHSDMRSCVEQDAQTTEGWYGQSVVDKVYQEENIHGANDHFVSKYECWFYVDQPGLWWFSTDSDDASEIMIDEQVVVEWYGGSRVFGVHDKWEINCAVIAFRTDQGGGEKRFSLRPDGSYDICGLPSGQYLLAAGISGYVPEYYDACYRWAEADRIDLSGNDHLTGIDFTLDAGALLSGQVKSPQGHGIGNAEINVYEAACGERIDVASYCTTDINGNYSVRVPSGDIYLSAEGSGWVSEYWDAADGTTDCELAARIPADTGDVLTGYDFILTPESCGFTTIPRKSISIDGEASDWDSLSPVYTDAIGDEAVDFDGTDIDRLYLARDEGYLYIMIRLADGAPLETPETLYVFQASQSPQSPDTWGDRYAVAAYEPDGSEWGAGVYERGSGAVIGTYPGSEYVGVGSDFIEWKVPIADMGDWVNRYLRCYTHAVGAEMPDVSVSDDNLTHIQMIENAGKITGTATGTSDRPLRDVWILATDDQCRYEPYRFSQKTDSIGQYSLILPPGGYYLRAYAAHMEGQDLWWDLDRVTPDCEKGAEVSITDGQTVSGVDFQLDTSQFGVSNLNQSADRSFTVSDARYQAQGFTTGSDTYILESVTVAVEAVNNDAGTFVVRICRDNGGRPGAQITDGVLAGPGRPTVGMNAYRTSADIVLSPNTDYWVTVQISSGNGDYNLSFTDSTSESGSWTILDHSAYSADSGASWNTEQANSIMRMDVTAQEYAQPSISGTVTDQDGHQLENIVVQLYDSPCWSDHIDSQTTDSDGAYAFRDIDTEDGIVYVQACGDCRHEPFMSYWWSYDRMIGDYECALADGIDTDAQTQADFQLREAPRRLNWWEVAKYEGQFSVGFDLPPVFEDQLQSATVTGPSGFSYTFDLINDRYDDMSDCAGFNYWWKPFDTPANDGTYTLSLRFKDDLERTYTLDRQFNSIPSVDPSTMAADLTDDGSIEFSWTSPRSGLGYQVQIYDADGKRLYESQRTWDIDRLTVDANELACLAIGASYEWQVKTFDDPQFPEYTAVRTSAANDNIAYTPNNLDNRIRWFIADRWPDGFACGFSVRPGSVPNVNEATVQGPDGFSYQFDLADDGFNLSTETQQGDKGWFHVCDTSAYPSGNYQLQVVFGDGTVLTAAEDYDDTAEILGVDADSMTHEILPDGGMIFDWDRPAEGQLYNLRIRDLAGDDPTDVKEYVNISTTGNHIDLHFWDLRALKLGETYEWFIRTYDTHWPYNKMLASERITFVFDPFQSGPIDETGDINGDQTVNLEDAVLALQICIGLEGSHPLNLAADVNGDSAIGMPEAVHILRHIADQ